MFSVIATISESGVCVVPVEPQQLYRNLTDTQHPTPQPRCHIVPDFNYLSFVLKGHCIQTNSARLFKNYGGQYVPRSCVMTSNTTSSSHSSDDEFIDRKNMEASMKRTRPM
ncbi:unnamed protein product [Boreogadus saida]